MIWRKPLAARSLGGVAATGRFVLVGDRALNDTADAFLCLDAESGRTVWSLRYPAPGKLDYGNTSRATPLIVGDRVFLFGAMGHLTCVDLASGRQLWQKDVRAEFDITARLPWGLCGSPLFIDDQLVLQPGGNEGSLVALDPATGDTIWATEGGPPSHGSLIAATLGGRRQLVGHDATSLGGWDAADGKRLWTIVPEFPNDFNVPTPVVHDGRLIVATENNGTRLFCFDRDGRIIKQPQAVREEIAPDVHSPVVVGNRLFIVHQGLFCLDLRNPLEVVWKGTDPAFSSHTSLIASGNRLLVITDSGELLLVDALADRLTIAGRTHLLPDETGMYAHPALVGDRLYLRGNSEVVCISIGN